jgi:sec-independent protein translocase protein TatC
MPLRQHLEELRRTLVRCFVAVVLLFGAGIALEPQLLKFVWVPWNTTRASLVASGAVDPGPLIYIGPAEGMLTALKVAFLFAALVGAPFLLWELWRFIGVGLVPSERAAVRRAFLPGLGLLIVGMVFGYTVLLPFGLEYLVSYLPQELAISQVTVSHYVKFVTALTLLMGFVFQTPLVMWAIVRAGLVQVATLRRSRRVAVLLLMVFAAVATPPDPVSMLLVGLPMIGLYEIGLLAGEVARRQRERRDRELI